MSLKLFAVRSVLSLSSPEDVQLLTPKIYESAASIFEPTLSTTENALRKTMRFMIYQSIKTLIRQSAYRGSAVGLALLLMSFPSVGMAQEQSPHQLRLEGVAAASLEDSGTFGGGFGVGYEYRIFDSLGIVGAFAGDLFPNEDSGMEDGTGSYIGLDGQVHEIEADGVIYPSTKLRYYGAGGGVRLHALPRTGSIDLWLGTGLKYVRIREQSRAGMDVGLGADFSFGQHGFALGTFVRYTQVIQPDDDSSGRDDDRFLQVGAALSWGAASKPSALYTEYDSDTDFDPEPESEVDVAPVPDSDPEPPLALQPAPEPMDGDGDGIDDTIDKCPTEPEDSDGFEDMDGCPDNDNDADGIADAEDDCRDLAGVAAKRGCPAKSVNPAKPKPVRREMVLPTRVAFAYGAKRVTPRGARNLREVLKVLKNDATILKLRVVGHTDDRGSTEVNRALSEERAQAVVDWLVGHGVSASRLQVAGRGAAEPRVTGQSKAAWRANRRVQFIITETSGQP